MRKNVNRPQDTRVTTMFLDSDLLTNRLSEESTLNHSYQDKVLPSTHSLTHSPNHSITYTNPLSHIHPLKHIRTQPSTRPLMASRKLSPWKASHGTRIMKATAAITVRKGRDRRLLPPIGATPRRPWVGRGTSGTPASDTPRWHGAGGTPG